MPRITRDLQFRVILAACALAEERGSVALDAITEEFGLDVEVAREILASVLYLEWRDGWGELTGKSRSFLLDEDDILTVDDGHWLRDLDSRPPDAADALRLLLSGMFAQASLRTTDRDLDAAVAKLRSIVEAAVVIEYAAPRSLDACRLALEQHRRLRVRYRSEYAGEVKEHTLEPCLVASKWANWYLQARTEGDDAVRTYRIDRIIDAEVTDDAFVPGEPGELPEWWQLDEYERTLRCRAPRRELDRIAQPVRVANEVLLPDGRVEADVIVIGAVRFDTALLVLGPDVEIISPPEAVARRREHAAEILARYTA